MSRITRLLVAAVFCVALAVPALSQAKPLHRGFNQTFPVASRLCNHAANGKLPKLLQTSSTQVLAACSTLRTSFTDAQNTWSTTVGPLKTQAFAALQTARQTCRQAHQAHTPGVCKAAKKTARQTIGALIAQVRTANQAYHASVEAARQAFWTTIRGLKGGASLPTDPTTPPAPSTSMPTDGQINAS
jgi:hypothetical protein